MRLEVDDEIFTSVLSDRPDVEQSLAYCVDPIVCQFALLLALALLSSLLISEALVGSEISVQGIAEASDFKFPNVYVLSVHPALFG